MVNVNSSDAGFWSEGHSLYKITNWSPGVSATTFDLFKDNLMVMGPATVYVADFGTTEPVDTGTLGAGWLNLGATLGGVTLHIKQTYETSATLIQMVEEANSRLKKRELSVETTLAEPTLTNLLYAMNQGSLTSGVGYQSYLPPAVDRATVLTYRAVVVDGWAPGVGVDDSSKRRRIILRKCLSSEAVDFTYGKGTQTGVKIHWDMHRVDGSTAPFKVIDEV